MAADHHFHSFFESHLPANWKYEDLRAADQDMCDNDDSELSDVLSPASPFDVDMEPFGSDPKIHPDPDPNCFSVQFLLPLEVRYPVKPPLA